MHSTVKTRLQDRRDRLARTLDHIRAQQSEVDANTEWKDVLAQRRRSELLADLFGWYHGRIERIDQALRRAQERPLQRPRA
jgi:hypothetical protein